MILRDIKVWGSKTSWSE